MTKLSWGALSEGNPAFFLCENVVGYFNMSPKLPYIFHTVEMSQLIMRGLTMQRNKSTVLWGALYRPLDITVYQQRRGTRLSICSNEPLHCSMAFLYYMKCGGRFKMHVPLADYDAYVHCRANNNVNCHNAHAYCRAMTSHAKWSILVLFFLSN